MKITAFELFNNQVKSEDLFETRKSKIGLNKRVQNRFASKSEEEYVEAIGKLSSIEQVYHYLTSRLKGLSVKYKELFNEDLLDTPTYYQSSAFDEGKSPYYISQNIKWKEWDNGQYESYNLRILIGYFFKHTHMQERTKDPSSSLAIMTNDEPLYNQIIIKYPKACKNLKTYNDEFVCPHFGSEEDDGSIDVKIIDFIASFLEEDFERIEEYYKNES